MHVATHMVNRDTADAEEEARAWALWSAAWGASSHWPAHYIADWADGGNEGGWGTGGWGSLDVVADNGWGWGSP